MTVEFDNHACTVSRASLVQYRTLLTNSRLTRHPHTWHTRVFTFGTFLLFVICTQKRVQAYYELEETLIDSCLCVIMCPLSVSLVGTALAQARETSSSNGRQPVQHSSALKLRHSTRAAGNRWADQPLQFAITESARRPCFCTVSFPTVLFPDWLSSLHRCQN